MATEASTFVSFSRSLKTLQNLAHFGVNQARTSSLSVTIPLPDAPPRTPQADQTKPPTKPKPGGRLTVPWGDRDTPGLSTNERLPRTYQFASRAVYQSAAGYRAPGVVCATPDRPASLQHSRLARCEPLPAAVARILEPPAGVEPATYRLQCDCSAN